MSTYVGLEIRNQLNAIGGRMMVWSWGAHNWVADDEPINLVDYKDAVKKIGVNNCKSFGVRGWLRFTVQGALFKGKVLVGLDASDLYEVALLNRQNRVMEYHTGLYFDELPFFLDRLIETPATMEAK